MEIYMEKRFIRTLVILLCGIAMALVAYAGQKGDPEADSREYLGKHREDSIQFSAPGRCLAAAEIQAPRGTLSGRSDHALL